MILITEQSYTKIFDTGDGAAFRKQQITLNGNASLYYRPSAVIPFQNSTFDGENDIYLDENSEFAWSDIMTAGRIAMNEQFLFKHYRNRVRVFINNKLIWMDHCLLEPAHIQMVCFSLISIHIRVPSIIMGQIISSVKFLNGIKHIWNH